MRDPRVGYGFAKTWDSETDYCAKVAMARQDEIDRLRVELSTLQAENAEKRKEITRVINEQLKLMDRAKLAEATLSRVEAERDAANRYLEKIDGMFGTAYPNEILAVLEEWRGAQGEA